MSDDGIISVQTARRSVWKSDIPVPDRPGAVSTIRVPVGCAMLHVAVQNETPRVWYLCDPESAFEDADLLVVGTGWVFGVPGGLPMQYLGTFVLHGRLVFHVFRLPPGSANLVDDGKKRGQGAGDSRDA